MFVVDDETKKIYRIMDRDDYDVEIGDDEWLDTRKPSVYVVSEKEVIECLTRSYL